MVNLIAFVNSFLSYLLLFGTFVLIAAVAIFIGITLRKRKDMKEASMESTEDVAAGVVADTTNE